MQIEFGTYNWRDFVIETHQLLDSQGCQTPFLVKIKFFAILKRHIFLHFFIKDYTERISNFCDIIELKNKMSFVHMISASTYGPGLYAPGPYKIRIFCECPDVGTV